MALPGIPTKGIASAGVAILARSGVGLRAHPELPHEVVPRRLQHAVLDVSGWPAISVMSAYLKDSIGAAGINAALLAQMGSMFSRITGPCLAGADWSMQVDELETSEFPRTASATMAAPKQITCRGGMGSTIIDYFAVNGVLLRGYRGIEADMTWSTRPHRP
eukprot:8961803-Pyramimonas_sp.AAC.1